MVARPLLSFPSGRLRSYSTSRAHIGPIAHFYCYTLFPTRMARHPRIISECPNVENTLPLATYRAQYPAWCSLLDDDKFVFHAGGPNYELHFSHNTATHAVALDPRLAHMDGAHVSLFVLNAVLIVWMEAAQMGLEVPYPLIGLHALKEEAGVPVLYLQVKSCELLSCVPLGADDFDLMVEISLAETAASGLPESPLFGERYNILQVYDALCTCSAFHYDTDSGSDDEADSGWITANADTQIPAQWTNMGVADDLGELDHAELDGDAGMNVAFHASQIAGSVRRRNSGSDVMAKVRKLA